MEGQTDWTEGLFLSGLHYDEGFLGVDRKDGGVFGRVEGVRGSGRAGKEIHSWSWVRDEWSLAYARLVLIAGLEGADDIFSKWAGFCYIMMINVDLFRELAGDGRRPPRATLRVQPLVVSFLSNLATSYRS